MDRKIANESGRTTRPRILIVEDSKSYADILAERITGALGYEVEWKGSYADAVKTLDCCGDEFLVSILALHLKDAPEGEIVSYARSKGLPAIVITNSLDESLRSRFLKWNVVDYFIKGAGDCCENVIEVISRMYKNSAIKTLVVDETKAMRDAVTLLLRSRLFQVLEASDDVEAMAMLDLNPDIRLMVTDFALQGQAGLDFIRRVRKRRSKNELAIIGLSASHDHLLSARLIKSGANDFLPKPFQVEEFHVRVGHSIEMLENIALIRNLSYTDALTRLHNRRYFFENADPFVEDALARGRRVSVAMLDIDLFKNINDTFGHDVGDVVLKRISAIIAERFNRVALTCRFGGEEFCILLAHAPGEDTITRFEDLRQAVEDAEIDIGGTVIRTTISIGVCTEPDSVKAMLKLADSRLYTAKETGRNRVVGRPPKANVR